MKAMEPTLIRAYRQEAKARLGRRGRWLSLVLYAILSTFLVMLPFALSLNVISLLSMTPLWIDGLFFDTVLPYLLMIPTFLLITCPCIMFVMRGVISTITGERRVAESKGRYERDLGIGLFILGRVLLPIALVLVAWSWPRALMDGARFLGFLIGGVMACAMAVLTVLWLHLTRRSFFVPYFAACGYSFGEARLRSRAMVNAYPRLPTVYLFSFVGALALSVLSLGVLFIFWTLPLMWMTYGLAASSLLNEQSHAGSNE